MRQRIVAIHAKRPSRYATPARHRRALKLLMSGNECLAQSTVSIFEDGLASDPVVSKNPSENSEVISMRRVSWILLPLFGTLLAPTDAREASVSKNISVTITPATQACHGAIELDGRDRPG
jgi:hypothetical protein